MIVMETKLKPCPFCGSRDVEAANIKKAYLVADTLKAERDRLRAALRKADVTVSEVGGDIERVLDETPLPASAKAIAKAPDRLARVSLDLLAALTNQQEEEKPYEECADRDKEIARLREALEDIAAACGDQLLSGPAKYCREIAHTALTNQQERLAMPKKVLALDPEVREEECYHVHAPWSGKIPCTGVRRCTMCGTVVPDDYRPPTSALREAQAAVRRKGRP